MVKKGEWVLIHRDILSPEERAPQVPEDTRKVPLEMWDKGHLLDDGELGETVRVRTWTGRLEEGTLLEVNPSYHHDFGNFVPELQTISQQVWDLVFGGEKS